MRAVLFDAVGTLFGVRGSVGDIYSEAARAFGIDIASTELDRRFRAAFAERRPPVVDARSWWRAVVAQTFAGVTFPDFDAYFAVVWERFATAEPWQLYPETLVVLKDLSERSYKLAVVSNFDERLYPVLKALGLEPYFQAIALSSEVGCAKPDPRLFAAALAKLDCAAIDALHIGDSPEDVIGARAAGIRALKVDRTENRANGTIGSLAEVLFALDADPGF